MRKKIFLGGLICLLACLLAVIFWFLTSRVPKETGDNTEKIKVAATIFPLYDLVRQVGGDKVETILILPPGSSPHTYEVAPAQVKELQKVKIFFAIGAGVDSWAENIAKAIDNVKIVDLDEYITLKPFEIQDHEHEEENHQEHDHDHGNFDPHYWLDPANAIIMVSQVAKELSLADENNKEFYESRAQAYIDTLSTKDLEWKAKINQLNKKDLAVFHDAWGYFAHHFGLKIVATFEPFPGKTPSPQYLIEYQEKIKEHSLTAIFVEPQLSKDVIKSFAKDLNVGVEVLDPLGGVEGRDTYIDLIDFNVDNIYKVLK